MPVARLRLRLGRLVCGSCCQYLARAASSTDCIGWFARVLGEDEGGLAEQRRSGDSME